MNKVTKGWTLCLLFACLFISCGGPKQPQVDRLIEDGVEIVINHQQPYRLSGEPETFSLEEQFRLDTEGQDLAALGIRSIDEFEIDGQGNIYLSTGKQVLVFDGQGHYVQALGKNGQGPGEYRMALGLRMMNTGEISFYDEENGKFLYFRPDGKWQKDVKKASTIFTFEGLSLDNGYFILRERHDEPEKGIRTFQYALLNEKFEKIKNFRPTYSVEIPYFQPSQINLLGHDMNCKVSQDLVFVGSNTGEFLEIEVYNFQGDLVRKIRREAGRVKLFDEFKEKTLKRWQKSPAWKEWDLEKKHHLPDFFPPFRQFWVDDEARIFVETYEKGEQEGEVLLQIFNPQGILIGFKSLAEARDRRFRNNCLYSVIRKESGYDEIVGYQMKWE